MNKTFLLSLNESDDIQDTNIQLLGGVSVQSITLS